MEVWTNGTISARTAVSMSAKILSEHLTLFIDLAEPQEMAEEVWKVAIEEGSLLALLGAGALLLSALLTAMYMLPIKEYVEWNMMSFVLKTKEGKLVVIDGGRENETENFFKLISSRLLLQENT